MKLWNIFGRERTEMPKDVQHAFLKILYYTCLAIRSESKQPDFCFALSDHAHNIPSLISNYSLGAFRYYWECERPCFIEKVQIQGLPIGFEEQWKIIETHYKSLK
jgi:hypothetical protein